MKWPFKIQYCSKPKEKFVWKQRIPTKENKMVGYGGCTMWNNINIEL